MRNVKSFQEFLEVIFKLTWFCNCGVIKYNSFALAHKRKKRTTQSVLKKCSSFDKLNSVQNID